MNSTNDSAFKGVGTHGGQPVSPDFLFYLLLISPIYLILNYLQIIQKARGLGVPLLIPMTLLKARMVWWMPLNRVCR